MPVVRRIRNRGATITVEANAEVLFMPSGDVHNWANRFTGRIKAFTEAAAPRNKRPRWGHYGKALHTTIVSARPRFWGNGRDKQRVYAAVGSTSPHAVYVDQGTGTFVGHSPWQAKILPPTEVGRGNLYEASWRPGGPQGKKVKPVYIKGQKGQEFFDKGLRRAFQSMRMRAYQVPVDPKIGNVLGSMPTGLENFSGATPNTAAFQASLETWREWRADAYQRDQFLRPSEKFQRDAEQQTAPMQGPTPAQIERQRQLDAFKATKAAADRRKKAADERLKAAQKAREEGQRKREQQQREREERDRKLREANEQRRGNAESQRLRDEAFFRIRQAFPDAFTSSGTLPDGVIVYRITYVLNGETVKLQWAYGYDG